MDSNPMVSSLLNKLANYTNLSQGVVEHEEHEEDSKRREVKVRPHPAWSLFPPPVPQPPRPLPSLSPSAPHLHLLSVFSPASLVPIPCFSPTSAPLSPLSP